MQSHRIAARIAVLFILATAITAFAQQGPLSITSRLPDNNAKNVCADTQLSLTFNRPPALGTTGKIKIFDAAYDKLIDTLDIATPVNMQTYTIEGVQFHAYPVIVNGNTATIYPHNNLLAYGNNYYVQIDAGVLTDGAAPFPGYADKTSWTFSTKPAAPAVGTSKLTIAADGTGDFATLQGAVDFVPARNTKLVTILLRNGIYREIVSMVDKANITMLGEDRAATTLTYANNERLQLGQNSSSKRGVINGLRSTGIAIANLTLRNATPKGGGQAETVIFKNNSQVLLTDVSLYSLQDTVQFSSAAYIQNAYIEGDVDFMWGTGPAFFQDCNFKSLSNGDAFIVSRNTAAVHGFIYNHCRFDVKDGVTGDWLGNNQNYANSEMVLLDCAISPTINPVAWRGQGPALHYWEFNSTNTTDGKPADTSARLAGSKRLTMEADADTIKNYRDPAFVLNKWNPALAPIIVRQPEKQSAAAGQEITLSAAAVAVPAATYQWSKDGAAIPGATQATLKIAKSAASDSGSYSVTAKNINGSATSSAAELTVK